MNIQLWSQQYELLNSFVDLLLGSYIYGFQEAQNKRKHLSKEKDSENLGNCCNSLALQINLAQIK